MAFALLLDLSSANGAWNVRPVGPGIASQIRTDSTGTPHIAVSRSGFRYSTLVGDTWEERSVLQFADDLALDQDDGVFFLDTPSPNFYPVLQFRLSNGLTLMTPIASHSVGELKFLGFDTNNRPHLAYNNTSTQQLIHNRWTGSSWAPSVVATDSQFRFGNPGFVSFLDSTDQAHFAWTNEAGRLRYSDPTTSTSWATSTLFSTLDARAVDLAVDGNGDTHLAYDVFTGLTSTGGLYYANNAANGTWQGGRIPKVKAFGSTRASLVLDKQGRPNLFDFEAPFSGPVDVVHYLRENGQWTATIINTHPDPQFSGPDRIAATFDGDNLQVLFSTGDSQAFFAIQEPESLPGDYNNDGAIDTADYTVWRDGGSPDSSQAGYNLWADNYGVPAAGATSPTNLQSVPEPPAAAALLFACLGTIGHSWRSAWTKLLLQLSRGHKEGGRSI